MLRLGICAQTALCYEYCLDRGSVVVEVLCNAMNIMVSECNLISKHLSPLIMKHVVAKDADLFMCSFAASFGYYPIAGSHINSIGERAFCVAVCTKQFFES